jgi:hypothetical protein
MSLNERMAAAKSSPNDPYVGAVAIDYSGGNQVLAVTGRGILLTTGGTLSVVMQDGSAAVLTLSANVDYRLAIREIKQSGSATAAGFVLL